MLQQLAIGGRTTLVNRRHTLHKELIAVLLLSITTNGQLWFLWDHRMTWCKTTMGDSSACEWQQQEARLQKILVFFTGLNCCFSSASRNRDHFRFKNHQSSRGRSTTSAEIPVSVQNHLNSEKLPGFTDISVKNRRVGRERPISPHDTSRINPSPTPPLA